MQKKSNLGRGLDALLGRKDKETTKEATTETTKQTSTSAASTQTQTATQTQAPAPTPAPTAPQTLPIDQIVRASYQPRQTFEAEALAELAQSIREKGVLQPLLVRPADDGQHYEIVAGERRWRASRLAGLTELPVIIRELSNTDALEIAIIENLQRESLSPVEEARAYQSLLDQGRRQEDVAQTVGKSRSTITNALRLLSLPAEILQALEQAEISTGHAKAILSQPQERRLWAFEQIMTRELSVREAEQLKKEQPETAKPATTPTSTDATVTVTATTNATTHEYRQVELVLSRRTGTKVRIVDRGLETGKGGKMELSFASREELERLLELLGYADAES